MFTLYCPVVDAEILRGPRSVLSMHNTADGVVTYVRCSCGQIAVMVTGQLATAPRVHHPHRPPAATAAAVAAAECA